jgi:hypothetical protein
LRNDLRADSVAGDYRDRKGFHGYKLNCSREQKLAGWSTPGKSTGVNYRHLRSGGHSDWLIGRDPYSEGM